jgi:hypothetical protein
LLVATPLIVIRRLWGAWRHQLEWGLLRHPLRRDLRAHAAQFLNASMFWGMAALSVDIALAPIQFEPDVYQGLRIILLVTSVLLIASQLVPPRRLSACINVLYALGWLFLCVEWTRVFLPQAACDSVTLAAPFRGEWYVLQGGRSALVNHHFPVPGQSHALDLVRLENGKEERGDPNRLESYAAFGQPLFAPAEGRVVRVVNDRPDMAIGKTDLVQLVGNHVIIEIAPDRYVMMAHIKKGSVSVRAGEHVERGQAIAACGNSGNTTAPHLHLQVQNRPRFEAAGLRTFPIQLDGVALLRGRKRTTGVATNLRRDDHILVSQ